MRVTESEARLEVRAGRVGALVLSTGALVVGALAVVCLTQGPPFIVALGLLALLAAIAAADLAVRLLVGVPMLVADSEGCSLLRRFGRYERVRWDEVGEIGPLVVLDVGVHLGLAEAGRSLATTQRPRATLWLGLTRHSQVRELAQRLEQRRGSAT